jgi:hypothetical protein
LYVEELRCGTGYDAYNTGYIKGDNGKYRRKAMWERRIDAFAMSLYPSRNFERVAYEVKVSHGDFVREIVAPEKREMAMSLSNRFYYVAPKGVIAPEEIPEGCGLLLVGQVEGKNYVGTYTAVPAPRREVPEPPLRFMASLARRLRDERK